MQYRRFGKTEVQIPVFSCGGMRYQYSWEDAETPNITAESQVNLRNCIHRAFDLGIHHIETARDYGTSEIQLGKVLHELPREELILQTKVPPYKDPKEFESVLEQSLSNLKMDHIDLFAFHGINLPEHLEWVMDGCYEVAERWRKEGKIRHIGFSTHASTDLIVKAIQTGLFDYVNLHYYFFMQKNDPAVVAATQRDMGVFIISPSDKGGRLYDPPQKLEELCNPYSPMVFNDLFCLNDPRIHTLSLGAAVPTDFDEHLKTLPLLEQGKKTDEIENVINKTLLDYHGAEWMNNWDKGLPEIHKTPGDVNLYEILRFYNMAKALDMVSFGNMRYTLLGEKNHWFPGTQVYDTNREDLLASLSNSPFPEKIVDAVFEADKLFK
ncbi:MAG: aldo/keto reductase [Lentisphaeraceae bacterium]|nr:aldo/keto reductase [Lentisphaeraceae bacterium]